MNARNFDDPPQRSGAGARIRARRLELGLSQADLADRAGMSASYLNLIEHGRRRIGGRRLVDIARPLGCDPARLSHGPAPALVGTLEALGAAQGLGDGARDLAERFPLWARHMAGQAEALARLSDRLSRQQDRLARDPALAAALHQIITSASAIQSASAILVGGDIDDDWRTRFQRNVHDDSRRLAQASEALVRFLDTLGAASGRDGAAQEGTPTGADDAEAELAAWRDRAGHHVADLETLPLGPDRADEVPRVIARIVARAGLSAGGSQALAHWLGRYADDAARIPLVSLERQLRCDEPAGDSGLAPMERPAPDPAALATQFGVGLDVMLRRLSTVPPAPGRPAMGLAVCDAAGALTLVKPIPGFAMPPSGGCPLWPLFEALTAPGRPIRALVRMPQTAPVMAYAIAVPEVTGFDGVPRVRSTMLVVAQAGTGTETGRAGEVRLVGAACRHCPRTACDARRPGTSPAPVGWTADVRGVAGGDLT